MGSVERSVCTTKFKLNNGLQIPAVGLGTFSGPGVTVEDDTVVEGIIHALRSGYRLLDTAQIQGNEHLIGKAVRESGVPRADITVITKFPGWFHGDPEAALNLSLQALGLDYVDIFLMHWPMSETPTDPPQPLPPGQSPTFAEAWKKMEGLVGPRCKSIGVSNFTQKTLDMLLETATVVPAVNQIELHVFNPNLNLIPYCQSKGIHVISWRTIGGLGPPNRPLDHDSVKTVAKAHDCSPAVVSLSWAVQRGVSVIPKSFNKTRIEENIKLATLSDAEMEELSNIYTTQKHRIAEYIPLLQVVVDGKQTIRGWSKADLGWEDADGNWLI